MPGKNDRPELTSSIALDTIPVPDAELHLFQTDTTDLRTIAEDISTTVHETTSYWSALSGCCSEPEDATLCAVFQPVATNEVEGALSPAATALDTITENDGEARPYILPLRAQTWPFLVSIEGDENWRRDGISGGVITQRRASGVTAGTCST